MKVKYERILEDNKSRLSVLDKSEYNKTVVINDYSVTQHDVSGLKDGDVFIIDSLNTLGCSNTSNLELIERLINKGVVVDVLNLGVIDDEKLTFIRKMFTYEKQRMVDKLKKSKDIAKKTNKDYRDGRPRSYTPEVEKYVLKLLNQGNTYGEIAKLTGISKATVSRIKNRNGLKI